MKRRSAPLDALLAAAVAAVAAVVLQAWFHSALDLRDFPGPASGYIVFSVARAVDLGAVSVNGVDNVIAAVVQAMPFDLLTSLRLLMVGTAGVAGAIGLALGGAALGGRWTGVAAGVVAACWSQSLFHGWTISYDGPAMGIAALGLGLALWGASRAGAWLLLVPAGLGLLVVAALTKEVAQPMLATMGVVPFVVLGQDRELRRALPHAGAAALMGAIVLWLGWGLVTGGEVAGPRHTEAALALDWSKLPAGLMRCLSLLRGRGWINVLLAVYGLAVVGAALPGRAWPGRIVLLLCQVGILAVVGLAIPDGWMRLRYLAVPSLPALLLAGVAVGRAAELLARRQAALGVLPVLLAAGLLVYDSISLAWDWNALRTTAMTVETPALPRVPPQAWSVNDKRVGAMYSDTSFIGATDLRELLVDQQGEGPAAVLSMRDGRHRHALAMVAIDAGRHGEELDRRRCCEAQGLRSSDCAAAVMDELDAAGALLVLPARADFRIDVADKNLYTSLVAEVEARGGGQRSERWLLWTGTGSGGPLHCGMELPRPRAETTRGPPPTPQGPPLGPPGSRGPQGAPSGPPGAPSGPDAPAPPR